MYNKITKLLLVLCIVSTLFLTSCVTTITEADLRSAADYRAFVPIDPLPSPTVVYTNDQGQTVATAWASLSNDERRKLLPNQTATMTTYKLDVSGEAQYLTSGVSGKAGVYRVVTDYAQYRTDPLVNGSGNELGKGRVGVGLRIKAEIQTFKAGVDLGSLIALGFAAKANKIRGRLEVHALGINSPEITTLFPTPSTIDETSIQKALEALAVIKSKLGDSATNLTPQVIAIRVDDSKVLEKTLLINRIE